MNWVGLIIGALIAVALCALAMAFFVIGARSEDEERRNQDFRRIEADKSISSTSARKSKRMH